MKVYADNAATTWVRHEVSSAMIESDKYYGNPSSLHSMGQKSKQLIDNARSKTAQSINAKQNEIIFTASGTAANNLAILGYAFANKGKHIITTAIEHSAVLKPCEYLQRLGYDITYLPVDNKGFINLNQLENSIRKDTFFISIIYANNEIGTIQLIAEIGKISKRYNICFHTDAIQAFGHCDIDVNKLGIDMMSISGHKLYAPKGIGVLYAKDNIILDPIIYGGGQEYGLVSGTENVNSIVGIGKAVELLESDRKNVSDNLLTLKNKFIDGMKTKIPNIKINNPMENSLNSIINVSFEGIEAETLLMALDSNGIYVSTGTACHSGSYGPSHVLKAIGLDDELAHSTLRFSFGKYNTEEEINYILEILPNLVDKLRKEAL